MGKRERDFHPQSGVDCRSSVEAKQERERTVCHQLSTVYVVCTVRRRRASISSLVAALLVGAMLHFFYGRARCHLHRHLDLFLLVSPVLAFVVCCPALTDGLWRVERGESPTTHKEERKRFAHSQIKPGVIRGGWIDRVERERVCRSLS